MREVISMASGPETRMHPMAPPWAVAMAQMVSWFILSSCFDSAKIMVSSQKSKLERCNLMVLF